MARYDLPVVIDHILDTTNQSGLHFVGKEMSLLRIPRLHYFCIHSKGHSQGTTVVMAMLAILPQYNEKIITMHLMCPIVFLKHSGVFFRTISAFTDQIEVHIFL